MLIKYIPFIETEDLLNINEKDVKQFCKGRGCRHHGIPELQPTAVCFYIKGSVCSHLEVKRRLDDLMPLCPGSLIDKIQFVPLTVHLDSLHSDNRYLGILMCVH